MAVKSISKDVSFLSLVTTSNGECKDTGKHCKYWKGKGFCNGSHEQFMTKYCPKSCNKC